MVERTIEEDVATVQQIETVHKILEVVCATTGMGYAAVARITPVHWVACSVSDKIEFGLGPGGELELESTFCHEVKNQLEPIVIDNVAKQPQ